MVRFWEWRLGAKWKGIDVDVRLISDLTPSREIVSVFPRKRVEGVGECIDLVVMCARREAGQFVEEGRVPGPGH